MPVFLRVVLGLWGPLAFRPILARFNGDATGGMMAGLGTDTLRKAINLYRW